MKKLLIFCALLGAVSGCAPFASVIDTGEVQVTFRDGNQSPVMYTPNRIYVYSDSVVRINAFGDRFVYSRNRASIKGHSVSIEDEIGTTIYRQNER